MKEKFNLEINNFGPINKANIELNTINVVGGVNGSGKSTVSKVLYSFLKANSQSRNEIILNEIIPDINQIINLSKNPKLYIPFSISSLLLDDIDENIMDEDSLNKALIELLMGVNNQMITNINYENFTVDDELSEIIKEYNIARDIVKDYNFVSDDLEDLYKYHRDYPNNSNYSDNILKEFKEIYLSDEYLTNEEIYENKQYLKYIYYDFILDGFHYKDTIGQIDSLIELLEENYGGYGYPLLSSINMKKESIDYFGYLKFFGDSFEYILNHNSSEFPFLYHPDFFSKGSFEKIIDVLYIDSISIFDLSRKFGKSIDFEHNKYIMDNLIEYNIYADTNYSCDEKTSYILDKLEKIIKGKFEGKIQLRYIKFPVENINSINKENDELSRESQISSGYKQLAVLYLLLLNNTLKPKSFLILDEPEVNLHPEWQFKFAEILVLLAKELDITLYINSHSPAFIESIDAFTEFYDMENDINYYLTEESENEGKYNFTKINSNELYKIYNNLGNVYHLIDQLRLRKKLGE